MIVYIPVAFYLGGICCHCCQYLSSRNMKKTKQRKKETNKQHDPHCIFLIESGDVLYLSVSACLFETSRYNIINENI